MSYQSKAGYHQLLHWFVMHVAGRLGYILESLKSSNFTENSYFLMKSIKWIVLRWILVGGRFWLLTTPVLSEPHTLTLTLDMYIIIILNNWNFPEISKAFCRQCILCLVASCYFPSLIEKFQKIHCIMLFSINEWLKYCLSKFGNFGNFLLKKSTHCWSLSPHTVLWKNIESPPYISLFALALLIQAFRSGWVYRCLYIRACSIQIYNQIFEYQLLSLRKKLCVKNKRFFAVINYRITLIICHFYIKITSFWVANDTCS
jgi:hypothetical protein